MANKDVKDKKKHIMLSVNVAASRKPLFDSIHKLADKINCRFTDLVWHLIETGMKTPPATAPAGASPTTGSAAGFWVVHKTNEAGRVTDVQVVHTDSRITIEGRLFYRYERDDEKSKARAEKQAQASAAYDCQVILNKVLEGPLPVLEAKRK